MSDPNPDTSRSPIENSPFGDGGNNKNDNPSASPDGGISASDSPHLSSYTFNGHVVIGIGIILAIAAATTILSMTVSQSPGVHISPNGIKLPFSQKQNAAAQQQSQVASSNQKIDKSFVLVAKDFGWNGTSTGPTIKVIKGDTVKITVINAGQMAHNFGLAKLSSETVKLLGETKNLSYAQRMQQIPYTVAEVMPCPGCDEKFDEGHIEFFIRPDAQATTVFTANEAGHFAYFCQVRGHIWLGMHGDFIVDNSSVSTVSAAQQMGGKT